MGYNNDETEGMQLKTHTHKQKKEKKNNQFRKEGREWRARLWQTGLEWGKSLHQLREQNAPKHLKEKGPEPIRNHQSAKRPIAACNREKGWERNRVQDRYRTWVKRTKGQGKDKRRSGRVSPAGSRAIKDKERTVIALNSMGKRKSRKGNRGRKCINKTSQTGVQ